ncbi:Uncharacterised protein [Candidatus Burarchaeum australiense]|nr:Uncharacterised protein [Candidatus Burarchaeum australiense]
MSQHAEPPNPETYTQDFAEKIERLVGITESGPNPAARCNAAQSLEKLSTSKLPPVRTVARLEISKRIPRLGLLLKTDDHETANEQLRMAIVTIFGNLADKRALPYLLEATPSQMLDDHIANALLQLVKASETSHCVLSLPELTAIKARLSELPALSETARQAAIVGVETRISNFEVRFNSCLEQLDYDHPGMVPGIVLAVNWLGENGGSRAVEDLVLRLDNTTYPDVPHAVRVAMAGALETLAGSADPAVKAKLNSHQLYLGATLGIEKDVSIAGSLARVLGKAGDEFALAPLFKARRHPIVDKCVADALGQLAKNCEDLSRKQLLAVAQYLRLLEKQNARLQKYDLTFGDPGTRYTRKDLDYALSYVRQALRAVNARLNEVGQRSGVQAVPAAQAQSRTPAVRAVQ